MHNFRNSLALDAPNYFDKQTGVLELPLHIKVADQVILFDAFYPYDNQVSYFFSF